jgi:hypothetical protein
MFRRRLIADSKHRNGDRVEICGHRCVGGESHRFSSGL